MHVTTHISEIQPNFIFIVNISLAFEELSLGLISRLVSINSFLKYYGPHKRVSQAQIISGLGYNLKMKVFLHTKNTVLRFNFFIISTQDCIPFFMGVL